MWLYIYVIHAQLFVSEYSTGRQKLVGDDTLAFAL